MGDLRLGVIGAGVVGLTTALELQKRFRQATVEIIADKFNSETTSYVAAGLFRPGISFCGPNENTTRKWISDSYDYWDEIRRSRDASNVGVAQLSGYIFSTKFRDLVRNHLIEKVVALYRPASDEELTLCPGNWKYGSFFTTLLIESGIYLPWATNQFKHNGGVLKNEVINSFKDISSQYDVVVNCTGLGAKFLCNDYKLVPIRGQVLKVDASWVKTFFYADYDTYIIPGFHSVTLGGCRQYDSYDLNINKYDGLNIKDRCEALLPSLKGATVKEQRVGLRPHRDPVRVELELLECNNKMTKIVHNYGHGGYGVTTAPGTALNAVKLVEESLSLNNKL